MRRFNPSQLRDKDTVEIKIHWLQNTIFQRCAHAFSEYNFKKRDGFMAVRSNCGKAIRNPPTDWIAGNHRRCKRCEEYVHRHIG